MDAEHFVDLVKAGKIPEPSDFNATGYLKHFSLPLDIYPDPEKLISVNTAIATRQKDNHIFVQVSKTAKTREIKRKPLNLVFLLDISHSMHKVDGCRKQKARMEWAKDAVSCVIDKLDDGDLVSIVLFDTDTITHMAPTKVKQKDKESIKKRVLLIGYGQKRTNLYKGLEKAYNMASQNKTDRRKNRVIMISDVQLNEGNQASNDHLHLISEYSSKGIDLTVLGIGAEFNQAFTDKITETTGASYRFAQSGDTLKQWFDHFENMVTPIAYDFRMFITIPGYKLVQRSTLIPCRGIDNTTGQVIHEATQFSYGPSGRHQGGGATLLEFEPVD